VQSAVSLQSSGTSFASFGRLHSPVSSVFTQQLLSSVDTNAHFSAMAGIKLAVSAINTEKGKSNISAAVLIINPR
jgi:hypothetical protein